MSIRSSTTIPERFTIPSRRANHPDEKKSLDERLLQRKRANRVHMDGSTFVAHYGHVKGKDDRLGPYTGSDPGPSPSERSSIK
jgi:hypothetical protein